jgi:Divergent InlB B-repeat domain
LSDRTVGSYPTDLLGGALRVSGRGPFLRRLILPLAACFLSVLAASAAFAQSTYVWNVDGTGDYSDQDNWTPRRNNSTTTDILVVDGSLTPSVVIEDIQAETIGAFRFLNSANVVLSATASRTLVMSGTGSPAFEIGPGSVVISNGTSPIQLNVASGATGLISGTLIFSGTSHRLVAAMAGALTFTSGSVFETAAGFSGSPFGTTGTADIAVFQSGATYRHGAGGNPFGLAPPASRVSFQAGSEFVALTPTGFVAAGRTYPHLRIANSSAISTSGIGNFQFDNLFVESGSSVAHSGSGAASIRIRGNVGSAGTGAISLISGSGEIHLEATGLQSLGGGGGTGTIQLGSPTNVPATTTLQVERAVTLSSTLVVNGAIQVAPGGSFSGAGTVQYGASGRLLFASSPGPISVDNAAYWPLLNGPSEIVVNGPGGISMASGANRVATNLLRVAGPITNAGEIAVTGTLQREAGGSVSGGPIYGASSTLRYLGGFTVGGEWGAGATVGAGVPKNITIAAGAGTVTLPSQDRYVNGNLTIENGTLALGPVAGNLLVRGNWTNSGTLVPNDRTVVMVGTANQTVARTTGNETFDVFQIVKGGGDVFLGSNVDIAKRLFLNGGDLITGAQTLSLTATTAYVVWTAGHVEGTLRKLIGTGPKSVPFEIGSNNRDAFLGVSFGSVSAGGYVTATTTSGDHSQLASTSFDPNLTANRFWTLSAPSVTFDSAAVTLYPDPADLDPGANPLTFEVGRWAGGWTNPAMGVVTDSSATATGLTAFGDFVVGNRQGHTITATSGAGGTIAPSGVVAVPHKANQLFTITPNAHYHVADVVVDSASVGAVTSYNFIDVKKNHTIHATFAIDRHTVAIDTVGGGTVARNPNLPDYAYGTPVQLTAAAAFGYQFGSWSGDTTATANPISVLVDGNLTITATFIANTYALSVNTTGPGIVYRQPNLAQYAFGSTVRLTASPEPGYGLIAWSGSASGSTTPLDLVINGPMNVTATFGTPSFPVSVTVNGPGSVSRSPDLSDYLVNSTVELTAIPDAGARFVGWSGSVSGGSNPVLLTVDAAEAVTAIFTTADFDYTLSRYTASYTALTEAGGAIPLMVAADDSVRSIPLPFIFSFAGNTYRTTSHLAISANGYAYLSRESVVSSSVASGINTSLYTTGAPNATLAPWFDNLSVGPVGTNPAGSVLYQTTGTPGSRNLVVQWTNVSSYAQTTAGQPRRLNFQLALFEATGVVEFRYGNANGADFSILESASIGIEDSIGGNNHYLDAVTGSRLTGTSMMTSNKWPTRHVRYTPGAPAPIPGGEYTVGIIASYPNLNEAFADLNHRGVAGPVTLNLTNAVYDSSAGGGRNVFPLLLGPIPGADATRPITIASGGGAVLRHRGTDNGNLIHQNATNVIGIANEPIVGVVGADYVTLSNVTLEGGAMVDRGLLVLNSSRSDGAQHNTFVDVTVQLDRTNAGSIGVEQTVPAVPTSADGANSHNRYLNLTVEDAYSGLALIGNGSWLDTGCEVGGAAGKARTTIGGATAGDIGGGSAPVFGIRALNQAGLLIRSTTVRNLAGNGTGAVEGIVVEPQGAVSTPQGMLEISGSLIHDLAQASPAGGRVVGIKVGVTANPQSVARVYNNLVHQLTSASTSTLSRRIVGIQAQEISLGHGGTIAIDFNSVRMAPAGLACPNAAFELGTQTGPVVQVRNNIFANFSGAQTGAARHYAMVVPGSGVIGPSGSVSNYNLLHVGNAANGFAGRAGGADRVTIGDWQAATAGDANSRSENPEFASSSNLHLSAVLPTPAESQGSMYSGALSWVADDVDGQPRSMTKPDVGADEGPFVRLPWLDLTALSVDLPPPGSTVAAGAPFTPRATFRNVGGATLAAVPVRFRILGPSPSNNVVYNQTGTTPTLPRDSSGVVNFSSANLATPGLYTLIARAELPMDEVTANDSVTTTVQVSGPLVGDYLVGSAQPAPFNTLTDAIGRLNTLGVGGAVRFLMTDASYGPLETFPITIQSYTGASAANTFTLRPASGNVVTLTGSSAQALIVLTGSDYVVLDGSNQVGGSSRDWTLDNQNTGTSAVIWVGSNGSNGATNNTVRNLRVRGSGTGTLVGVGFGGPTVSLTSSGNNNASNRIENVRAERAQVGFYTSGSPASGKATGTVITGNDLDAASPDNLTRFGILSRYEDGIQITENVVGNLNGNGFDDVIGIALGATSVTSNSFTGDEVLNAQVSANVVDVVSGGSAGAAGIAVVRAASGTNTLVNNMVSRVISTPPSGRLTAGILVGGGGTTRVWFNSVSMSGNRGTATGRGFALAIGDSTNPMDVRNNLLVTTQTSTGTATHAIGIVEGGSFASLTSNHNDLYSASTALAMVGGLAGPQGQTVADLAAWRTRTGEDAASISADPLYQSNGNLHITSVLSPAANIGQPIAGVTTDVDGETGSRTTLPDLGADEFITWSLATAVVGGGTVQRTPDQPSYAPSSSVQIQAMPNTGWVFSSWSGSVSGSTNPTNVFMDGHKSVTATFTVATYALTIDIVGSGTVTKNPNQATYSHGTVVNLTANPTVGFNFTGWSGDTTASANPLPVVMNRAKTITATFAILTYPLTVNVTGSGSVARNPDQASYNHGTTVTLTATPATGWSFTNWSGSVSGTSNPIQVVMNGPRTVTATFTINTYALNITVAGNGSVARNPDQALYNHGTSVQLTATPATGWTFTSWSGDATGSTNPTTVVMNGPRSVTATFTINTYALTVNVVGSGSVARNPDQPLYNHGTVVALTATPGTGWSFTNWSGNASGSSNPVNVTMNGPRTVTATFTINSYTLSVSVTGSGSVDKNPDQPTYTHGTNVTLTATPAAGYNFAGWMGDATGMTNPLVVPMTSNKMITAMFAVDSYTLTVNLVGNGSVTRDPNLSSYPFDTDVVLTAVPSSGWHFVQWSGDLTGATNPQTLNMDDNKTVTATFAINTYALDVTIVGSGSGAKSPNQALYDHGTVVQLTATPSSGWSFTAWSGDATGSTNPVNVTMDGPRAVTATFTANTYALSVSVVGNGSVVKNPNLAEYGHGTVVTLTANAATGWGFSGWSGDASGFVNPVQVTMNGPRSVTATFEINTYVLDLSIVGNGSVFANPDQSFYDHGTIVTLTATPAPGRSFVGWSGDASGSQNPIPITMDAPKSVTATFTLNLHLLSVSGGTHGEVSVTIETPAEGAKSDEVVSRRAKDDSGTGAVPGSGTVTDADSETNTFGHGTLLVLTATPKPGWAFAGWLGDATGSVNPMQVLMNQPKTISASFVRSVQNATPVTVLEFGRVHPNPGVGPITIEFGVPADGRVRLTLVDVQGRLAGVLIDENRVAGRHEVRWESRGTRPGVYFACLEAGGRREIRRVVLR